MMIDEDVFALAVVAAALLGAGIAAFVVAWMHAPEDRGDA